MHYEIYLPLQANVLSDLDKVGLALALEPRVGAGHGGHSKL